MAATKNRNGAKTIFSEKERFKQYSSLIESNPTISNVFYLGDMIYPALCRHRKGWMTRKMTALLKQAEEKGISSELEDKSVEIAKYFLQKAYDSLGPVTRINVEIALNELS